MNKINKQANIWKYRILNVFVVVTTQLLNIFTPQPLLNMDKNKLN